MKRSLDCPLVPASYNLHSFLNNIRLNSHINKIIILLTGMELIKIGSLWKNFFNIIVRAKGILNHWLCLIMSPFTIHNKPVLVASRVQRDLAGEVSILFDHRMFVSPSRPLSNQVNFFSWVRPG